jgi:hypothetical protein
MMNLPDDESKNGSQFDISEGRPQHALLQAYRLRYAGGIVANKNAVSISLSVSIKSGSQRKKPLQTASELGLCYWQRSERC